jgi:hypothetical protein
MTIENRQFIELQDIIGLRFTCRNCGAQLRVARADEYGAVVCSCLRPHCDMSWIKDQSLEYLALNKFLSGIEELIEADKGMGASLQLEIKQPEKRD